MISCPYKGLVPYTEEDAAYFFGRSIERRIIADNLQACRLTVLYGASGVGKSSVLSAGLAYDLRNDPDSILVTIRNWRDDPLFNLNATLSRRFLSIPGFSGATLKPEDRDFYHKLDEHLTSSDRTLLVVLDQFEEYFQYHPNENGAGTFIEEFPRLANERDLPIHFLISVGEDSLASLDRFKQQIPDLLDNRLSIDFLSPEAAKDAILRPLDKFNENMLGAPIIMTEHLAANVVQQIIEAQGTERWRVQTPYLQLVLTRWWERETELGSRMMRAETLTEMGGVKKIVNEYLQTILTKLEPREQSATAAAFAFMVTPAGRKIAQTTSELAGSIHSERSDLESLLEKLCGARVLTSVPPPRGGSSNEKCYEFAHDVVAKAALEWREQFRQVQDLATKEALLEAETRRATKFRRLAWSLPGLLLILIIAVTIAGYVIRGNIEERNRLRADPLLLETDGQLKALQNNYEALRDHPDTQQDVNARADQLIKQILSIDDKNLNWSAQLFKYEHVCYAWGIVGSTAINSAMRLKASENMLEACGRANAIISKVNSTLKWIEVDQTLPRVDRLSAVGICIRWQITRDPADLIKIRELIKNLPPAYIARTSGKNRDLATLLGG